MPVDPKEHIRRVIRISDRPEPQKNLVRLDKNERIMPFSEDSFQALLGTLSSEDLTGYPEPEPMYDAVADWAGVRRECILLTGGSDQAIKSVFEVYVEAGDTIVLPRPTFAMYGVYADMFGARRRELRYTRQLVLTADAVCGAIASDVKLIALPNPNSPTGTVFGRADLERILACARDHGALLLVDEAYYPFSPETALPLIERYDNLVVTRTFSKACGLAGVRLGFMVSALGNIDYLRRVKPMYEANGLALKLGRFLIESSHLIRDYVADAAAGKAFLQQRFGSVGRPFDSAGNFLLVRLPPEVDIPRLVAGLKARGFLIKGPFSDEPLTDCIRITTGPAGLMAEFWKAFQDVFPSAVVGPRSTEGA